MITRRQILRALSWTTALAGLSTASSGRGCGAWWDEPTDDKARLARLQGQRVSSLRFLGSHNSYHIAPDAVAANLIRLVAPDGARQLDYTHPPLTEQLEQWGLRQFEWDLYLDSEGGRFASPAAWLTAQRQEFDVPPFDPNGEMEQPGIKILHAPDFDYRSHNHSLRDGLRELRRWSESQPGHEPVFMLLELKDESYLPSTRPEAWEPEGLVHLEREILEELPRESIFAPRDLAADFPTLREAVTERGWPTLAELLGKVVFLLDNEGRVRNRYLDLPGGYRDRLLFTSVAADHPAAAWMKRNDPIGQEVEIKRLVAQGFMVRTRADAGLAPRLLESATPTERTAQRDAAFRCGAQLISSDFACDSSSAPDYGVRQGSGVQVFLASDEPDFEP